MLNIKKRINIMSSCDENYAGLVPVQLVSIADNLLSPALGGVYEVHYYLFHSNVSPKTIGRLSALCETLGIFFHSIFIADTAPYAELAKSGGGWRYEAYFSLECHRYLPPELDRIMYIDAADVLILGDIGEFYFSDFEDKSLLCTCARYKLEPSGSYTVYESDDLGDSELREGILRGLFNSGSYLLNLDKLRRENMSLNDYLALKDALVRVYPGREQIYFGDQGLLSAAFAGDIKYFEYPQAKNFWYQPYNFCVWFFDRSPEICGGNPWYTPKILHFAGNIKPWTLTSENANELKPGQWPFYKIYQLYANQVGL